MKLDRPTKDRETRDAIAALKRKIKEIEAPEWETKRKERRAERRARDKRVGQREKGQRQPRARDPLFLAFVRRQPCAVAHMGGCEGKVQAAHIRYSDASKGARNPGMQAKAHDRHCNPLCAAHHLHDQHQRSERAFWSDAGLDAYDNAARLYRAYQEQP